MRSDKIMMMKRNNNLIIQNEELKGTPFGYVFLNCELTAGPGAGTSGRVSWSHCLSKKEAGKYTPGNIFKSRILQEPSVSEWIRK